MCFKIQQLSDLAEGGGGHNTRATETAKNSSLSED